MRFFIKKSILLICGWLAISRPSISNFNSFNAVGSARRADIFQILINSLVQTIDSKIKLKRQIFSNDPIFILSLQVYLIGPQMSLFGENIEDDAVKFNNFRVSFRIFRNVQKLKYFSIRFMALECSYSCLSLSSLGCKLSIK